MPYPQDVLDDAAAALRANPPAPADKAETLCATTHLIKIPDADAKALQQDILASSTAILRKPEDLPKLDAIIYAWKREVKKATAKNSWHPDNARLADQEFFSEHVLGRNPYKKD